MAKKKINILYVDDELNNLNCFTANFRKTYNLFIASSGKEGLEILKENDIHIIISDQRMPDMTGTKFLAKAREMNPKPMRMILTAFSDADVLKEAINKINIYKWLEKPFEEGQIKNAIKDAFEVYELREEGKEIINKLLIMNEKLGAVLTQKQLLAELIIKSYEHLN